MRILICFALSLSASAVAFAQPATVEGKAVEGSEIRYCRTHDVYDKCWRNGGGGGGSAPTPPNRPITMKDIGRQLKLEVGKSIAKAGAEGLLDALFGSGSSDSEARRMEEERAAEHRRLEALRVETERLERIETAARMREEWDRNDAEMSKRLEGVFDVPIKRSTPFFGIPGNPDDEAVAEAIAQDSDPWRAMFDGGRPGDALRTLESQLRIGPEEGTRVFEVEAGDGVAPDEWDLRDALAPLPGAPGGAAFIPTPSRELTNLLEGTGRVTPRIVEPRPTPELLIIPQVDLPREVLPRPIKHLQEIGPSNPPTLTVIRRGCDCGGDDCTCISKICGGTKGCSCKSVSGSNCGCNGSYCKRSVRSCCNGTHQNGAGQQTCNATCGCAPGECRCTAGCGCSGK